ncbi:DUF3551 domain-containing protein [Bradyrhizobium liaoningense]|uniref:DUF3551 domain-containing protein n=1 Tax=Bradyrhizobium liaoningense TaxID=43992 RepID=UPI0032DFF11E
MSASVRAHLGHHHKLGLEAEKATARSRTATQERRIAVFRRPKEILIMRMVLAIAALLAAGTAAVAGPASPASPVSYDYPWCVYGGQLGPSGDCSYETREQCLASASGRSNVTCSENTRLLFRQQNAQPPRAYRSR